MAKMADIERGIGAYLDNELLSDYEADSAERWLIGSAIAIFVKKKMAVLERFLSSPMAVELEMVDADGNIDLDILRDELKRRIPANGAVYKNAIVEKFFGSLRFQSDDIDKLYKYITNKEE